MAKDPAVLFYTSDFLTGTMTLTDEQTGKYIRLLCLQHQKGCLTEKDMMNICKTYDKDIFDKFIFDDGNYYNVRMREEAVKRKNYSESRKNNRSKKDMLNISKTYVRHMENENEDENINVIALNNKSDTSGKNFDQFLLRTWGGKDGRASPSLLKQFVELGDRHGWDKLCQAVETAETYNKKSFAYVKAILEPSQTKSGEEKRSETAAEAWLRKKQQENK